MAYSQNFRDRVLAIKSDKHLTIKATLQRFCIGITTVKNWLKDPILKTTRNKPATKINMETLQRHVTDMPDSFGYERAIDFGCSSSGIYAALKRLNFSYKKL